MQGNNLKDEGLISLSEGLKLNESLKIIDVSQCRCKEAGGIIFAKVSTNHKNLHKVFNLIFLFSFLNFNKIKRLF